MKRWIMLAVVLTLAGCGKKNAATGNNVAQNSPQNEKKSAAASSSKKPPLSRAVGEQKFNGIDDALPVGSTLAEVIRYFGQEPDRTFQRAENNVAVWVLDDGSEIEADFDMGKLGNVRADLKPKK